MAAHLEPAYAGVPVAALPNTERITRDSLILPLHHLLTEADQDYIVNVLRGHPASVEPPIPTSSLASAPPSAALRLSPDAGRRSDAPQNT
jgi:hypothetical protein